VHEIGRGELRAPAGVLDIDIAGPRGGGDVVDVERYATAFCLVRRNGVATAIRFFDITGDSSIGLTTLRRSICASRLPPPVEPSGASDGSLTVVICTRDRREGLLKTLASLSQQSDLLFDVLIVDNSRDGDVARSWDGVDGLKIRCCHEPVPGLSHARNRALSEVRSEFIAWIDDDEVADHDWVAWIKRGFATPDRPDAVAGMMLPAELETNAQVNFERYGGFNKGRGMDPVRLLAGTSSVPNPLYPLPNFGAGGNMAFRTDALHAIGGFDNRLGAGTLTQGGEETRALSLLLQRGSLILHWPPAVTWHYHRRTDAELEKQFFGYSAGLTAFYMSLIISSPKYAVPVLKLVFRGMKRMQANRRVGHPDGPPADFPESLLRAGRRGLCQGAWLYLREAVRHRHAAASGSRQ
jgi:glycosyltransferase involved in cell wall biosynthesis